MLSLANYDAPDLALTKEDYTEVYSAMDGSNITCLTHGAWKSLCRLQAEQRARWEAGVTLPPGWLENHPITHCWMDKLAQMSGYYLPVNIYGRDMLDNYAYVARR